MIETVFLLLIVFQIKHWLADYAFQGYPLANSMYGKFAADANTWIPALGQHVAVHAAMTLGISLAFGAGSMALVYAAFDASVHFAMDRVKADPKLMGRWKPWDGTPKDFKVALRTHRKSTRLWSNSLFWWALGFDQAVHHLTHYAIIWFLVS